MAGLDEVGHEREYGRGDRELRVSPAARLGLHQPVPAFLSKASSWSGYDNDVSPPVMCVGALKAVHLPQQPQGVVVRLDEGRAGFPNAG